MSNKSLGLGIDQMPLGDAPYALDKIALGRVCLVFSLIREVASDVGVQAIHVLLEVARRPGITVSELMAKTKLSQASCSRNLALLSKCHRLGKPGYDFVFTYEDPEDRRRKVARLTSKGEEFVALIVDAVR